jgi:ferric enterobactin receptor
LIQKKFGAYTGWASYTLGRVEYLFPDLSEDPFPAAHDSTHEFKLVNSYAWRSWTFAATWIYATGKPYTPLDGVEEVALFEDRVMERPIYGAKNSARLPPYHRLDVSATYGLKIGKSQAIAGLTLFNLYNRKNVWYKEFQIVQGELVENDFTYMGFTLNAFFTIRF